MSTIPYLHDTPDHVSQGAPLLDRRIWKHDGKRVHCPSGVGSLVRGDEHSTPHRVRAGT